MGKLRRILALAVFILLGCYDLLIYNPATAQNVPTSTILIGQIKITSSNGQFVSLYNNTNAEIDMSTVQLAYYNYYDLTGSKLTTSRYIALSGKLAPHNYYLVSDGAMMICYKMTVNAQSLGFSSTAGTVQVMQNGLTNLLDSVSWSKTAVVTPAGVQTSPSSTDGFLQRAWVDGLSKTANDPWISVTPAGPDGCDLQTQISSSTTPAAGGTPQIVKTITPSDSANVAANTNNIGLVAPEVTELFPNPAAPETDDGDEFIELYNPNDAVFNLTGHRIEAGTSYSRGYTFTKETLQPKSYAVFKITDTNLQLSNSEGQVRLLSPEGTTLSETPAYEDAPEGESWSIIGDSWQWTDNPTPGAVNLPTSKLPDASKSSTSASKTAKKTTTKAASNGSSSGNAEESELDDVAPLHPGILAGVGAAAVAYAIYEYRSDMANRIFQFRRYLRNRRTARA
jgi:hypothetical protein